MQKLFDFFNQGWVSSLIGIAGLILAVIGIFSYKISKSAPKPSFQKSALRLLGKYENNLPSEVRVFFKNREVERLTKTKIILWNNGTETLDGKNIVNSDPLQMSFEEGDNILSYEIIGKTRDVNNFQITKEDSTKHKLLMTFDYLDPSDGVVVEILHDSENKYPTITGTIKGLRNGFLDLGIVEYSLRQSRDTKFKLPIGNIYISQKIVLVAPIIVGSLLTSVGFLPPDIREHFFATLHKVDDDNNTPPILYIIAGLTYILAPALLLWFKRRKYPKQLQLEQLKLDEF